MKKHTTATSKLLKAASRETNDLPIITKVLAEYPQNKWVDPKDNYDPAHFTVFTMLENLGLAIKVRLPIRNKAGEVIGSATKYLYNHNLDFSQVIK